ncbi:MAG: hypothetical protein DME26_12435, partial [Verrucomicrobia bacterium]
MEPGENLPFKAYEFQIRRFDKDISTGELCAFFLRNVVVRQLALFHLRGARFARRRLAAVARPNAHRLPGVG